MQFANQRKQTETHLFPCTHKRALRLIPTSSLTQYATPLTVTSPPYPEPENPSKKHITKDRKWNGTEGLIPSCQALLLYCCCSLLSSRPAFSSVDICAPPVPYITPILLLIPLSFNSPYPLGPPSSFWNRGPRVPSFNIGDWVSFVLRLGVCVVGQTPRKADCCE